MNKLDELINELCPDGVEYKELGKFATILRGGNFQKKDFTESGVPCIHYGQIYTKYGLYASETITFIKQDVAKKSKFASKNDIVMAVTSENIEDVCKCVVWLGEENVAISGHTAIIKHNQNPKFLAYYFQTAMFCNDKVKLAHGTKVIEVTPSKLAAIKIPLPPLPVQEEIVRILDSFTKLTAELTAELTARKKQYEYYRDSLLTFGDNVKQKELGEICFVTKLAGYEFTDHIRYSDVGEIIALRGLNVKNGKLDLGQVKYIDGSNFEKLSRSKLVIDDMLFTYVGTVGQVALIDQDNKYYLAPNVALIRVKCPIILPKFMQYYFQTNMFINHQINKLLQNSSMKNLTMEKIRKFKIPLPPLPEQQRIINILDRFDTLCNDISQGLPAEIKARQQQYEYYRDKLLTFKKKEA